MKSRILIRFLSLVAVMATLSLMAAAAGEVSKNEALAIAGKVVRQYFPAERQMTAGNISVISAKNDDPFYVCAVGTDGYVLVSKSENCPPVLGFSWEGGFPSASSQTPALLNNVIDNIRLKCAEFNSMDTVSPRVVQSWKALSGTKSGENLKSGAIFPLLTTTWNVDASFFELFPKDYKAGGSVPIAMGQVFRFYATPALGEGELCYILNGYGELCTKFGLGRLNFSSMSNTMGNSAVDSLIYYMSVTCMMQPEGASLAGYKQTLPVHFRYSNNMRSVEAWEHNLGKVILHQLSLRHPVPAEWLGQAFVIDGYFPDNLFHFNMGLGGLYNGVYLLDYPVVKVDTDHSLLTCYTDYHPRSEMPGVLNLTAAAEGDSIRVSWTTTMSDSLHNLLVRYVVLRDGLVPVAETRQSSVLLSNTTIGGSCNLRVVADFGQNGSSELSEPYLYVSNQTLADIPSLALRQLINTKLGASDLLSQPTLGQLELIKDLEITFPDQRGLEKLPKLMNLRIDGTNIRTLRDGDYINRLQHLRFFKCSDFDFTIFGKTGSLLQLYGYDYLPFDLFEFRHNADLGLAMFTTTGTNPNMLMDLYGADKYFPKLADFYVRHLSAGVSSNYEDCFVSYESFLDFYPKIKSNLNLLTRTKPTSFAPCYPTPARNSNLPSVNRLSWQSNYKNQPDVYYNVFVGTSRKSLDLVSVFQTDKFYDGTFDANKDYYWRVEAYHVDSIYYSGIYHFSTWQDLPIPFVERFDDYYSSCPVVEESPFWINIDSKLTGKAVTSRTVKYDGNYSLEMKPKSDAAVLIKTPKDPKYFVEFRVRNQGGELAAELLQKSGSSDDNIVNARVEFLGKDIGLFTYGTSSFPFTFIENEWNRVNLSMDMNTGLASLMLNETVIKEWQWHVQIGGTANSNPFKGIRFVNNATASTATSFIDDVVIDLVNPASTNPVMLPQIGMVYRNDSREVVVSGIEPWDIRDIALYDIQGRKLVVRDNPSDLIFTVGRDIKKGIYLVVVNRKAGAPGSMKIAVLD